MPTDFSSAEPEPQRANLCLGMAWLVVDQLFFSLILPWFTTAFWLCSRLMLWATGGDVPMSLRTPWDTLCYT